MPSNLRVGALDHPERFGRKSVAVYTNSNGPYFVLDGVRESVHGSQLWTTLSNVKMRGVAPVLAAGGLPDGEPEPDGADADLEAAIAASLAVQAQDAPVPMEEDEPAPAAPPAAPPVEAAGQDDAAGGGNANGARECCICLTEAVDTLLRPCNHLVACSSCARRLARRSCPVCRRPVRSVERVFF